MPPKYPAINRLIAARLSTAPGAARDLANKIGVSEATVSRWRTGETSPHERYWSKIAEHLGITQKEMEAATGKGPALAAYAASHSHLGEELPSGTFPLLGQELAGRQQSDSTPDAKVVELARHFRMSRRRLAVPADLLDDHLPGDGLLGEFRLRVHLLQIGLDLAIRDHEFRMEEDWFTTYLQDVHFALNRARELRNDPASGWSPADEIAAEDLRLLGVQIESALPPAYLADLLSWEVELRARRAAEQGKPLTDDERAAELEVLHGRLARPARDRLTAAAADFALSPPKGGDEQEGARD